MSIDFRICCVFKVLDYFVCFFRSSSLFVIIVMSSTKARTLIVSFFILKPSISFFSFKISGSINKIYRYMDRGHPCRTPLCMGISLPISPFILIFMVVFFVDYLNHFNKFELNLYFWSNLNKNSGSTRS